MFLRNQFFFFRTYFKIMDRMNCIAFSWNPIRDFFELSQSSARKKLCYTLSNLHFLYMCAATYVFISWKIRDEFSTVSLASHLTFLTSQWYCLLFRRSYTTKAHELVELMNSAILLEKRHFYSDTDNSKQIYGAHAKLIIIIIAMFYRIQAREWNTFVPFWNDSNGSCGVSYSNLSCSYWMPHFWYCRTSNKGYGCFDGLAPGRQRKSLLHFVLLLCWLNFCRTRCLSGHHVRV